MLRAYLRCRLLKLEKYVMFILDNESEQEKLLPQELQYAQVKSFYFLTSSQVCTLQFFSVLLLLWIITKQMSLVLSLGLIVCLRDNFDNLKNFINTSPLLLLKAPAICFVSHKEHFPCQSDSVNAWRSRHHLDHNPIFVRKHRVQQWIKRVYCWAWKLVLKTPVQFKTRHRGRCKSSTCFLRNTLDFQFAFGIYRKQRTIFGDIKVNWVPASQFQRQCQISSQEQKALCECDCLTTEVV